MSKVFLIITSLAFSLWNIGGVTGYAADPPHPTHLFAAWNEGSVYLGWRLDPNNPQTGYNVYRKDPGKDGFTKLTDTPIDDSTNFTDSSAASGKSYQYRVCAVVGGKKSDPATVSIGPKSLHNNVYRRIGGIIPDTNQGKVKVGDIDGDGLPDFMIVTHSQPKDNDPDNLHVKVYKNDGKKVCDINMGETELNSRTAWTLWDLDGDHRDELIGVMRSAPGKEEYELHVIDPTGCKVLASIKVPSCTDHELKPPAKTTRYKTISIAYLDGKIPHILYASGHQQGQTMDVRAYTFRKPDTITEAWNYQVKIHPRKKKEKPYYRPEGCLTNCKTNISSSHQFEVADIDGDGKDEAFLGAYTFDEKGFNGFWGKHLWSHSDVVRVDYIRPGQNTQDVCFWLEQSDDGIHLTDSKGKELCHVKNSKVYGGGHAHAGWTGDVIKELKGQEIWVFYKNRTNGTSSCQLYELKRTKDNKYSMKPLLNKKEKAKNLGYGTVDWDGTLPLEVICNSMIQQFVIKRDGKYMVRAISPAQNLGNGNAIAMDIIGDYREEILSFGQSKDGSLLLTVYTNTKENHRRKSSPCESRQYMQRHRWSGH